MNIEEIVTCAAAYADKCWNEEMVSLRRMQRPAAISEEEWPRIQAEEIRHHVECGHTNFIEFYGVKLDGQLNLTGYILAHPNYTALKKEVAEALSRRRADQSDENIIPILICPFQIDDERHWPERRLRRTFPKVKLAEVDRFEAAMLSILSGAASHIGKGYRTAFIEGARHVGFRVAATGAADLNYPFEHLSGNQANLDGLPAWLKDFDV